MSEIDKGIAFVVEGHTEKHFYLSLINHLCVKYRCATIHSGDSVDPYFVIDCKKSKKIVKINNVSTITQMVNSGAWFKNTCIQKHKQIPWVVFLCYDTDSPNMPISKFHDGDWKELRTKYLCDAEDVIDLAAQADIEDIMLVDFNGVCDFIGIPVNSVPSGRKGKVKLKSLYRTGGKYYHEGERSKPLIQSLNMDLIIKKSGIPLNKVEEHCFKK